MATHIKHIISQFLQKTKEQKDEKEQIQEIIEQVLEAKIKKYVRFEDVYKKNLIFYSAEAGARFDFNLKKNKLLKKIKEKFPEIEGIKIRTK